jgi:hypothetical protein
MKDRWGTNSYSLNLLVLTSDCYSRDRMDIRC